MSKIKPFKLKRPTTGKSSQRLASDAQLVDLNRKVSTLGTLFDRYDRMLSMYVEQLAELNLRTRFIMEMFQYEKGATVIDPITHRPVVTEVSSLYQLYLKDRDRFLAALEGGHGQTPRTDDSAETSGVEPSSSFADPRVRPDAQARDERGHASGLVLTDRPTRAS